MSTGESYSRGAQLLELWRGERTQKQVCDAVDLDTATYNRFEHGVRKPSAAIGFALESLTKGEVPAKSWYEPSDERLSRRIAKLRDKRAAA